MEPILLNCNHCGNVIETTRDTKFLTCLFCDSQLEVIRTSSSIYTKVKLDHHPISTIQNNSLIHTQQSFSNPSPPRVSNSQVQQYTIIQKEIDDLDVAWNQELQQYKINGALPTNNEFENVFIPLVIATFGGILAISGASASPTLIFIGAFLMVVAIIFAVINNSKKQEYLEAKVLYEDKREQLIKQLPATPLLP